MSPPTVRDPVLTYTSRRERISCAIGAKNWIRWFAGALSLTAFCVSSPAQWAQSGTNRVTFSGSIKGVVFQSAQSAASLSPKVVRSELTMAEVQATLSISVALKMRNFAELQKRIGNLEVISLEEMATRYYPTPADYKLVADWLISQGFAVKSADTCNLSVFATGSVYQRKLKRRTL